MLSKLSSAISRISEFVAATILAAIFIIFLLQIFTRYAPKIAWLAPLAAVEAWMTSLVPIGWTVNLISLLRVWLIFIGCSTFVRDRDHIVFDVFFNALPYGARRGLGMATGAFLIGVMLYAFGPTYDAIFDSRLMDLKKIQTLSLPITGDRIPVKWLFAPFVLFMFATVIRYGIGLYRLSTAGPGEGHDDDGSRTALRG